MGQTIKTLAKESLPDRPVFDNRFVIEVCEKFHIHYRNLRLVFGLTDFIKFCEGVGSGLKRWTMRGSPEPDKRKHIEICRARVATDEADNKVQINLNKNLYKSNKDRIFAEGAGIDSDTYIHLKIRDIRIELSINDFLVIADAFKKADNKFKNSDISSLLQTT